MLKYTQITYYLVIMLLLFYYSSKYSSLNFVYNIVNAEFYLSHY